MGGARSQRSRADLGLGDLTAVVVDWNFPEHTIRCVRALSADGIPPGRIVVVVNGPTDSTWATISSELRSSVLVRVGANVGFAAANNIGARALPGRAYLLVNNDAFVHRPGSVGKLVKELDRPGVGVVVPRLLNTDLSLQPSVVPFTVPLVALARASGLSRLVPNRWQPHVSTHWDHASSREIEAAIGPVMLVDGHLWTQLAGLHEAAFMYAEDLDLCWRARARGWKTWFAGDAEFIHVGGASSGRRWSSRERSELVARAEAAMIRGHLSPPQAALTLAFMRLGLAARVGCFGLMRKTEAAASCRGSLEGLRQAPVARLDAAGHVPSVEVVRPV
jgi:N-acetylglucosaminyl-diphospho-decaprenol L-rhamnosyltransferase